MTCKGDPRGFSRNSHEHALTLRCDIKKLQKGPGQTSPQVSPPLPQGEFGSDMSSSWSSNGAGLSDFTYLSWFVHLTDESPLCRAQIQSQALTREWKPFGLGTKLPVRRTLVFASSSGSFWHFAICKHYQRAFHTCLETEVRASSWQVESNTLCHKDFQSKSIQLCYIKSTLHP